MFLNFLSNPTLRQYAVVIIVNLAIFIWGINLGWPSPVLVKLQDEEQTVLSAPLTASQGGWMVSCAFLSSCATNFLVPYILDGIGRKYSAMAALIPRLIACLLFIFAKEFWMLVLGRVINGIADSLTIIVVPVYATEVASKDLRGRLGTILQVSSSLGIVSMLSIGPYISYYAINMMCITLTVLAFLPIIFLPDSPYFLYSKGRSDEAMKVLTYLRGSTELAKEELSEFNSDNTEESVNKLELFKNRIFLKAMVIVGILAIGTQLIGFQAVSFYLQTILISTRTNLSSELGSVIIGFIQLFASVIVVLIMERFGRKVILGVTLIIMCFGMFGLGLFFQLNYGMEVTGFMNYVPLISLILVVFGYSAGPGTVFWPLISELFAGPGRPIGVSFFMVTITFCIFLLTNYFHVLTTAIGPALTYWIFGVNCILLCLFILFLIPETKGRSIQEIQESLGAKSSTQEKSLGANVNRTMDLHIPEKTLV